jgi:hypothetical protein
MANGEPIWMVRAASGFGFLPSAPVARSVRRNSSP